MHRTDSLRLPVAEDPEALAKRLRARERAEAAEALAAVAALLAIVGTLAGWSLPV